MLGSRSHFPAKEYRIKAGKVEAKVLDNKSDPENSWWQLSPEELSSHVRRNTVVAQWLEQNLGWRKLLWACVGEEPIKTDITGSYDSRAA
jgi:hypothetical protein